MHLPRLLLLFYELFTPVNKSSSLLAVYFNIVATTMQAAMAIILLAPLVLLGASSTQPSSRQISCRDSLSPP